MYVESLRFYLKIKPNIKLKKIEVWIGHPTIMTNDPSLQLVESSFMYKYVHMESWFGELCSVSKSSYSHTVYRHRRFYLIYIMGNLEVLPKLQLTLVSEKKNTWGPSKNIKNYLTSTRHHTKITQDGCKQYLAISRGVSLLRAPYVFQEIQWPNHPPCPNSLSPLSPIATLATISSERFLQTKEI